MVKGDTTTKVQIKDRLNTSILKEDILNISADHASSNQKSLHIKGDFE
jgi:hypothetical protein